MLPNQRKVEHSSEKACKVMHFKIRGKTHKSSELVFGSFVPPERLPNHEHLLTPFLFLCFQLCSLDFHCLGSLGSPPLLSLIFLSLVWFIFLDFLIILFDFVDFSIDVHDLGDVLEA